MKNSNYSVLGTVIKLISWLGAIVFGRDRLAYVLSFTGMAKFVLYSIGAIATCCLVWLNFPTLLNFITGLSVGWNKTEYTGYQAFLTKLITWFTLFILISGVVVFDRLAWVKIKGNFGAKIVFIVCAVIFNVANEALSWSSYADKKVEEFALGEADKKRSKYEVKEAKYDEEIKAISSFIDELKADKKNLKKDLVTAQNELNLWNKRFYSWSKKKQYVVNQIEHYKSAVAETKKKLSQVREEIAKNQANKKNLIKGIKVENLQINKRYFADLDFQRFFGGMRGVGLGLIIFSVSTALHFVGGTKYTVNFQLTEKTVNADGMLSYGNSPRSGRALRSSRPVQTSQNRLQSRLQKSEKKSTKTSEQKNEPISEPLSERIERKIEQASNNLAHVGSTVMNFFKKGTKNRTNERNVVVNSPDSEAENNSLSSSSFINLDRTNQETNERKPNEEMNENRTKTERRDERKPNEFSFVSSKNQNKMQVRKTLLKKFSTHRFADYLPDLIDIIEGESNDSIYSFAQRVTNEHGRHENFTQGSLKSFGHRLEAKYHELLSSK